MPAAAVAMGNVAAVEPSVFIAQAEPGQKHGHSQQEPADRGDHLSPVQRLQIKLHGAAQPNRSGSFAGSLEFRQLFPEGRRVELEEALDSVRVPPGAGEDRPYVLVNFISTADGRATFEGRSGQLGDDGD